MSKVPPTMLLPQPPSHYITAFSSSYPPHDQCLLICIGVFSLSVSTPHLLPTSMLASFSSPSISLRPLLSSALLLLGLPHALNSILNHATGLLGTQFHRKIKLDCIGFICYDVKKPGPQQLDGPSRSASQQSWNLGSVKQQDPGLNKNRCSQIQAHRITMCPCQLATKVSDHHLEGKKRLATSTS